MEDHIHCETTGMFLGYRDLLNMDEPVWTNSMCNNLGRLSQGWKKHAGTNTMEFILHKDKPKYRRATYARVDCNIRSQKIETHRTRLTSGGNIIDHTGEVRTTTSYLNTMKLHINIAISYIKSRYMCMDVQNVSLKNQMDRAEYIII